MIFSEIYNEILLKSGKPNTSSSEYTDLLNTIKRRINIAYTSLYKIKGVWGEKKGFIILPAPYTTGTIAITTLTKEMTITTGEFSKDMEGRVIKLTSAAGVADDYSYLIDRYESTSTAHLEVNYQGGTLTAATLNILKTHYLLPPDFAEVKFKRMWIKGEGQITAGDEEGFSFDSVSTGTPAKYFIDKLSDKAYHYDSDETAVIATSGGISTVTVSGGTPFTSAMVDRYIRIIGEETQYKIRSITSTTVAILDTLYKNSDGTNTLSATAFEIDPAGRQQAVFTPLTDAIHIAEFTYFSTPLKLLHDNDVPLIPDDFHNIITKKALLELIEYEGVSAEGIDLQLLAREVAKGEADLGMIAAKRSSEDFLGEEKQPESTSGYSYYNNNKGDFD